MGHICDEYGGVIKRDVCNDFFFSLTMEGLRKFRYFFSYSKVSGCQMDHNHLLTCFLGK